MLPPIKVGPRFGKREPRRGADGNAEPAAADIPAIDADINSDELIAARPPQVLVMHDPSGGSQVRPCSREPLHRRQYLGQCKDAYHDSMSMCGAR
jgi:hypothetical protein